MRPRLSYWPLAFNSYTRQPVAAAGASRLPLRSCPSGWAYHLASPVHHCQAVFTVLPHFVLRYRQMRPEVTRDAPDHRWPQFGAVRGPLPYLPDGPLSSGMCAGSAELVVLTRCVTHCPSTSSPMRSIAAVSPTKCTCPRLSPAVSSGTWAIRLRPVRQPLPSRIRRSNARRPSRSPRIGSGAS